MTVINPNSVAGINSITVQTGEALSVHKADGTLISTIVTAAGVSTFSKVEIKKGTSGGATANTDTVLTLDNNSHSYITFRTPNNKEQGLLFGDDADNDAGNIIYNHSDNALTFATSGGTNERLRIDSAGQIGIGAITPDTWSTGKAITIGTSQATLWGVGDQVNLSGNAYFNSSWKAAATKAGASQIQQALGQIDLRVTGSVTADAAITWIDALRVTNTGQTKLNIASNGALTEPLVLRNSGTGAGTNVGMVFSNGDESSSGAGVLARIKAIDVDNFDSDLVFETGLKSGFSNTTIERLRITSTGQLELSKDQDGVTGRPTNRIVFKDTDSSVAANQPIGEISWYSTDSGMVNVNSYIRGINEATNGSGALTFGVKAAGSSEIEVLRITSSGAVGISSLIPRSGFKLDVNGDLSLGESGGTDNTYLEQKQNGDFHIINSGRDSDGGSNTGGAGGIGINRYNTLAGGTSNFRDFTVYNGKDTKVLVVDGSASGVGIGTDAPVSQFNLKMTARTSAFRITDSNSTADCLRAGCQSDGDGMLQLRTTGGAGPVLFDASGVSYITGGDFAVGGTSVGDDGSFGVQSSGAFRSVLSASTASDTLLGAISGVSNGFQINITDANAQTYKFHNGSQQSMTLDSSGRLLLGTTATTGGTQKLQVVESTGGRLVLARDDTTVSNGADLGIIQAYGNDNDGNYQEVAAIHFAADLNHGTNDKPGRIVFKTTSDGGSSSSERVRINRDGQLLVGTTSSSYKFHVDATSLAAELSVDNDTSNHLVALNTTNSVNADFNIQHKANLTSIGTGVNVPLYFHIDGGTNAGNQSGSDKRVMSLHSDSLRPITNDSKDLGSESLRWRNVYTTDLQLSNKGKVNDVDGTWGNYTIQEGENDLFLLNRRNGKKFKFNLTEVV